MIQGIITRIKNLESLNGSKLILLCEYPDGTEKELNISEFEENCKNLRLVRVVKGSRISELDRLLTAYITGNI
jgi:hypothetical protein